MSTKVRATIPQDWHEGDGFCYLVVCVPDSLQWRATVKALIHQLARGRYWRADGPRKSDDPDAIEIIDVQAIGRRIYGSVCIVCEDKINQFLQSQLLLYSGFTGQPVNLNLTDNPIWAVDSDGNPLAANQFGDAEGNFTGQSPLKTTFDETWSSYNITDTLYYSFNESFSFFPTPDGAKSFHELVRDFYSPALAIRDNLDRIHDAIRNRLNDLIAKLGQLFSLQSVDVDFFSEGFNITTLLASALTDYSDQYPGIWTWLLGGNPKSYFSHTPDSGSEQSLAKIICDKETGGGDSDTLAGTLSRLFELAEDDPNLRDPALRTHAQLLNALGTPADAPDAPDYTDLFTTMEGHLTNLQYLADLNKLGGLNDINTTLDTRLDALESIISNLVDSTDDAQVALNSSLKLINEALREGIVSQTEAQQAIKAAIESLEVTAIAAADGSVINYKTCCDASTDTASTGDGSGSSTVGDDGGVPLPDYGDGVLGDIANDVECTLVITPILVDFMGAYVWLLDSLEWLDKHTTVSEIVELAIEWGISAGLWSSRTLAFLNITIGFGPDPSDAFTLAAWVLMEFLARFLAKASAEVQDQAARALYGCIVSNRGLLEAWECDVTNGDKLMAAVTGIRDCMNTAVSDSNLLSELADDFISSLYTTLFNLGALKSTKLDQVIDK